ncbi:hypothetical protein [Gorillibacterium sp. sgz5001074]|uniref:hypothetical protein n=1 Tax=Gorillibacterium sp. sgz5001074 TaxID=3446695 RepID=UPI003F67F294
MRMNKINLALASLLLTLPATPAAAYAGAEPPREKVQSPCAVVLKPVKELPNAVGAALVSHVKQPYTDKPDSPVWEREAVSIHADWLPAPSSFGDYDRYEGFAQVPGQISWRFVLQPAPPVESFVKGSTWVGNIHDISYSLPDYTRVEVRLSSSKTDQLGPAVLANTLQGCR